MSSYKVDNIESKSNASAIRDTIDSTKNIKFNLINVSSNTTRTLTIPNNNFTVAGEDVVQILTNKTINATNNTITNISNSEIKSGAAIDATKIADGSVSNTKFQYLSGLTSNAVGLSTTQTLTNKTMTDSSTYFQNNADNTKKVQLQLSGLTTGTTRTLTVPDANITIADASHTHDWDDATGTVDVIPFNNVFSNPTHIEGKIFYDQNEHTLAVYNDQSAITHQLGQEGLIRVYNNSGSSISDGKPVYISGTEGTENRPTIALGRSDVQSTSKVIGVTTQTINNNSFGYITKWGLVNNIDTSSFASGDTLFLDETTAGSFRNNKPPDGNYLVCIGYVIKTHVSIGRILVSITSDLSDTIGENGMVWQGTWVSQNYIVDDGVEYNGSSYICILNTISNEVPTNTTYWDVLALKGAQGVNWQNTWVSQNYVVYDAVEYNGASYICKLNTVSNEIPTNTTYWDILADKGAGETNTVSNVGTNGIGIFKQKTGSDLEFKKINAGSSKVTVTDDIGNNEVDVDITESNIVIGNLSGAPIGAVIGTSDIQTLTNKTLTATSNDVSAKSLHSATTIVDVSSATAPSNGQILTATSSTTATWQTNSPSLTTSSITATTNTSTTSSTYVVINGMTTTPSSGTYIVTFSASGSHSNGSSDATYAIHSNGSIVAHSERNHGWRGAAHTNDFEMSIHSQAIITVNGSQSIDVRYQCGGNGIFTVHERSMILLKV